ncbi:MAG: hypothetical protein ACT4NY_16750 [Pseudonocardiales bacterium]
MLARKVGQPVPVPCVVTSHMTRPPAPGPPADDQASLPPAVDLAALHAALRCGRSLPVRHLVESDEAFAQRYHTREVIVLCCADVAEPDPDVEDPDCPGCRDCVRYCPECAREAARFSAEASPALSVIHSLGRQRDGLA